MSESDPSVIWVSEGLESSFVNHDMMVEPAESDQVVGLGRPAFAPGDDVMCLESIVGITAVAGADVAVTQQNGTTQGRRGCPKSPSIFHESSVLGSGNDLGGGVTEDSSESIDADPRPGFQDHR
jgi:hypothetical protein